MFRHRVFLTSVLALALTLLLLAAAPAAAQHYGYSGGYRHGGYSGSYHGYSPSHYGRYSPHYGYYPGNYGYSRHYGYYPSYSHYGLSLYPGYYGYPQGYYHGYVPYYSSSSLGYYSSSAPALRYQAYHPPSTAAYGSTTPAAPIGVDRVVHFDIRVPADAAIWFDGVRTTSTGPSREFVSPALAPGREYNYEVRAQWKEDGREVSQSRRVSVRAGERVSVAFPLQEKGSVP